MKKTARKKSTTTSTSVYEVRLPLPDCEEKEGCEICDEQFGEGESARSRVAPAQCHYCYTNGVEEEEA